MSLFEDQNQAIGLSDLLTRASRAIKQVFRAAVWVRVEVHARKDAPAGHVYLDVIDTANSAVKARANLWGRDGASRLRDAERARGEPLRPGETLFVLVNPVLDPRFGFSLTVLDVTFADSVGPAERARLNAIKRLKEEGLFDANRQLPAPEMPLRVALVAPVGAEGRRDFETILSQTAVRLRHFPATFQSEAAKAEIPEAIRRAVAWGPDVIVLARGGGAKSDLIFLNAYEIGRAICESPAPVFSGIGHATDETLIDNVAHLSLPTPTAAANKIAGLVADNLRSLRETMELAARAAMASRERALGLTGQLMRTGGLCGQHALKSAQAQNVAQRERAEAGVAGCVYKARARLEQLVALPHKPHELLQERVNHLLAASRNAAARVAALADPAPLIQRLRLDVNAGLRSAADRIRGDHRAGFEAARSGIRIAEARAGSAWRLLDPLGRSTIAAAFSACEREWAKALRHDIEGPLRNGFALVLDSRGRRVRTAGQAPHEMTIQFEDGAVAVRKREG